MEFEDSRNALFVEPNAYIQHFDNNTPQKFNAKKVFSEPYEGTPSYSQKKDNQPMQQVNQPHKSLFDGFDFKSLLPLLGALGGTNNGLGSIVSKLATGEGFNLSSILPELMSNKNLVSSLLSGFGGKKKTEKKEMKSTDFEIENYTRVEE